MGTITEIYDYLRLLFARAGEPRCPDHDLELKAQTVSQMVDQVLALPEGTRLMLLAPVVRERKGEHVHLFEQLRQQGFIRARIDGVVVDLDDAPKLEKNKKHNIDVVVDRFKVRDDLKLRLAESFETALNLAEGLAAISPLDRQKGDGEADDQLFSAKFACPVCDYSLTGLEPRLFSFNNPVGACPSCDGLGVRQFFDIDRVVQHPEASISEGAIRGWDRRNLFYFTMLESLGEHYGFDIDTPFDKLTPKHQQAILYGSGDQEIDFSYVNDRGTVYRRTHVFEGIIPNMERRYRDTESNMVREELSRYLNTQSCPSCQGTRLRREARNVFVDGRTLSQITAIPVGESYDYFEKLDLPGRQGEIAEKIIKEIRERFRFLVDVGLNYLTLDRSADTLSGGEAQRIRLASQIGAGLVGVMYVLDEPSIGLHQRDNERLLNTLSRLRDLGNTVIVVEHDEDAIRQADHVIDIGPGAGVHGGEVVAEGTLQQIVQSPRSETGKFMSGERKIEVPAERIAAGDKVLSLCGASGNNLQQVDLQIPVGLFTCVTGVSGSGKSTLINETLYPLAATELNRATTLKAAPINALRGWSISTSASTSTRAPSAGPRAPTPPPTPVSSPPFGNCLPAPRRRARAVISRAGSALTSRAAAARPARATASPRWRCTFCRTSTYPATCARASATTGKPWKWSTRARTSTKCWR